jgi:hypothetical protein
MTGKAMKPTTLAAALAAVLISIATAQAQVAPVSTIIQQTPQEKAGAAEAQLAAMQAQMQQMQTQLTFANDTATMYHDELATWIKHANDVLKAKDDQIAALTAKSGTAERAGAAPVPPPAAPKADAPPPVPKAKP